MQVVETIEGLRKALEVEKRSNRAVGFVPTMGALHEGHLSLIRRAQNECDIVVVSIFVNPLQFGGNEDLAQYPRPFEQDVELASYNGVHYVFAPSASEMYPTAEPQVSVNVGLLGDVLEGEHRPGHFDGVATVVTKLFSIVGECRAYFGEKDWQQLLIVRQLAADLSLPVTVVGCPTVREPDGLALSSRNSYLNPAQRIAATALKRALDVGVKAKGATTYSLKAAMMEVMNSEPLVEPLYAEILGDRLLVAANVGDTHLIDNCALIGL